MQCCKKAKQSVKDTAKAVGLLSFLYGWTTNDLRAASLLNTFLQISNYLIKNDKEVQKNIGTIIACKFKEFSFLSLF